MNEAVRQTMSQNMQLTRRHALCLALGLAQPGAWAAAALHWRETALLAFGTTLWLRAGHADGAQAQRGLDAAARAVQAVEQAMSLFRPDSELARLNTEGVLHQPSHALVQVLHSCTAAI